MEPLFPFSTVLRERPFETGARLLDLNYDLIESGMDLDRFHATEDLQAVRDRVFSIIRSDLRRTTVEALFRQRNQVLLIEKRSAD